MQTDAVRVVLPYPPTVNTYWRVHQGRAILSRRGRDYRQAAAIAMLGCGSVHGRVAVTLRAYMPDNRNRDIDNINKACLDALHHNEAIDDDSAIDRLVIERAGLDRANPRVEVEIRPVGEQQESK